MDVFPREFSEDIHPMHVIINDVFRVRTTDRRTEMSKLSLEQNYKT